MHVLAIINGIRTRKTDPSWAPAFEAWVAKRYRETVTLYQHYFATAIAPFTIWVANPRHAKHLAMRLEPFARLPDFRLDIASHSNGTNIAALLMRDLARQGIRTHRAVLVGSALQSRIDRSGIKELIDERNLQRAIAYTSPNDRVVRRLEGIPGQWGALGAKGFMRPDGTIAGPRLNGYQTVLEGMEAEKTRYVTRVFPRFGHGEYFDERNREQTFQTIAADLGL